jgi:hypothetical protein
LLGRRVRWVRRFEGANNSLPSGGAARGFRGSGYEVELASQEQGRQQQEKEDPSCE